MQSLTALCASLFEGAKPLRRVLFRVDAGRIPGLSFGHLSRCLLLSRTLRGQGVATAFLMRNHADGTGYAGRCGETVLPADAATVRDHEAQALVVDLPYDPEPEIIDEARRLGLWLVFIDDVGRSQIGADVVLNTGILAQPAMYPRVRRSLLGPEHFFLADEDAALAGGRTARRDDASPPRVAMTFGGSDPAGLTVKALAALVAARLPLEMTVVLGPGFAEQEVVRGLAERLAATVIAAPDRLLPILCAADAVVCAGGRTLYECQALGLPTMAVASSDAEAATVRAFCDRGLIRAGLTQWDGPTFVHEMEKLCAP